jgi:prevent-host-death family protein
MITTRILPVREVREKMSQLLNETAKGGEPIIITRHGRPVGYLINYEVFNRLLERLEDMEDIHAMREAETAWRDGKGRDFEEFVAELEGAA